jgi:predicted dehydrogenase
VVSDKPLTIEYGEAKELVALAKKNDLLFGVTYTYTGYPTVKQISHLVRSGEIGTIRFVNAEYPQEWLAKRTENSGNRQAAWRTDPSFSGKSNCVGDIGSHIENMVATMTGLRIARLSARLDTFVDGRLLDDNATIMVDYEGGARGLYWSSQIAIGCENALRVRIFGTTGTIEWFQEDPDHFRLTKIGEPTQIWSRGRNPFVDKAQSFSRIPAGHPEGVYEAFANIYKAFATALSKKLSGEKSCAFDIDFPTVEQGADGVQFINKCVESSSNGSAWVTFE